MQLQKPEPFVDLEFKKPAIQQFLEISRSGMPLKELTDFPFCWGGWGYPKWPAFDSQILGLGIDQ